MAKIAPTLKGLDADFVAADKKMLALDGTEMKSKLGANAILGVSMALCRATADSQGKTLHSFLETAYYDTFLTQSGKVPYRGVTIPTPMMSIWKRSVASLGRGSSAQKFRRPSRETIR